MIHGLSGPKEYSLVLTEARSIFVLERATHATANYFLGGGIGILAGNLLNERKTHDYSQENIDQFIQNKDNIVILHYQVQKISIKKPLGSPYSLYLEYTDVGTGKNKKIRAFLIPPKEYIKQKKSEGIKEKIAVEEYAKKIQEAFTKSLPQSVILSAEWI